MLPAISRAGIVLLALVSVPQLRPQHIAAPPEGAGRVVLSVDRPRFFLGENVLLRYCLENTSSKPFQIEYGGDSRFSSRSQRFKMRVTDETGALVADPDPRGYHEGGGGGEPVIAPHDHWCQSLALMRYARIDGPGTYTIAVTHDLGWPPGTAPEGRTTVTFDRPSPEQAERVTQEMLALPTPAKARIRPYGEPPDPYQDFSTLRDPVYLQPLLRLIAAGHAEALAGLGGMATPEATRALIDLLGQPDPAVARSAAQTLAMRLPDPALDGALPGRGPFTNDLEDPRRYLRDASWRPEFSSDVRSAARRLLTAADVQDIVEGAFMIEAVGEAADGPSLSAALVVGLNRTLTLPFEKGIYPRPRGAMQELMRAGTVLLARGYVPRPAPDRAGDLVLWLAAFEKAARPDNWIELLQMALGHRIPYVRELALGHLPADAPPRLFEFVGGALESSDVDLKIEGCNAVKRLKLSEYRDAVAAIVQTAQKSETFLMNLSANALYVVGGRVEVMEIMARRVAEPEMWSEAFGWLEGAFADIRGSGGSAEQADLPAVSARWLSFIAAHRAELEAGQKFSLEDPAVTPDLVPRGYTLSRAGKPDWPVKR